MTDIKPETPIEGAVFPAIETGVGVVAPKVSVELHPTSPELFGANLTPKVPQTSTPVIDDVAVPSAQSFPSAVPQTQVRLVNSANKWHTTASAAREGTIASPTLRQLFLAPHTYATAGIQ